MDPFRLVIMLRNWYGHKKIVKEDRYTRNSNRYSEWEITKEKLQIVLYIALGALYIYFIIQPQNW